MYEILRPIDSLLNRVTMYRLTVYGLSLLVVVGFVFGVTDALGISEWGLLVSTGLLVAVCYLTNRVLAAIMHVATNSESWLITALILVLILPPLTDADRLLPIVFTGLIAMASKYLIAYQAKHIFNPAAIAAFIVSVFHILPVTWWVGSPSMLPFTILIGFLIVRKIRKLQFVSLFIFSAIATMVLVTAADGLSVNEAVKNLFLSWPLIFMGTVMLTEPSTIPPTRYYQLLTAAIVGIVFSSQIIVGPIATTPQFALLIGNVLAYACSPRYNLRLRFRKRKTVAKEIYEYAFEMPANRRAVFSAGQYLEMTVPHGKPDSRGNRRTFSIASSPTEKQLRITVREPDQSSSFKQALAHLTPGKQVMAGHIAGNFIMPEDATRPMVWIAGGIGITPFVSMAQYLIDTRQKRNIRLFYLTHTPEEVAYQDMFTTAQAMGLKADYRSDGSRLEAATLTAHTSPDTQWFISGPQAMVAYYKAILIRQGVRPYRISTDYFSGY
jgi:ferredoxin-NADP reductase